MYRRFIEQRAEEVLSDTPLVLIVGSRQAGKTTLVGKMGEAGRTYITLDNQSVLSAVQSDPASFIRDLDRTIIDEIRRAPDLLLAINKTIEGDHRSGRFLQRGSANVLPLLRIADSPAGRMETIYMFPLDMAEVEGWTPNILERLFEGKLKSRRNTVTCDDLVQLVLLGDFPESISRNTERRRQDWLRSYLRSILTRDLRDITDLEKLTELTKFLKLLAQHLGQLVNNSQFAVGISRHPQNGAPLCRVARTELSGHNGTTMVQQCFKSHRQDAPKLHFLVSGLLATVRGLTFDRAKADRAPFSALPESFLVSEVLKLMSALDLWLAPHHLRYHDMREVDIVLERDDGMILGIEVKASPTVRTGNFGVLRAFGRSVRRSLGFRRIPLRQRGCRVVRDRLAAALL